MKSLNQMNVLAVVEVDKTVSSVKDCRQVVNQLANY